jgi:hypothetical protein
MGSVGQGWKRLDNPDDADPESEGNPIWVRPGERKLPANLRPVTLAWVLGWPPLFITAFVISDKLHDPSDEEPADFLYLLNGVNTGELVAFLVGVGGVIVWIVGTLVLLFLSDS